MPDSLARLKLASRQPTWRRGKAKLVEPSCGVWGQGQAGAGAGAGAGTGAGRGWCHQRTSFSVSTEAHAIDASMYRSA